jgi:hypothetical protein
MVWSGRKVQRVRIPALIRNPGGSAMAATGKYGCGKSSLLAEMPTLHDGRTVTLRANRSEFHLLFSGRTELRHETGEHAFGPVIERMAKSPVDGKAWASQWLIVWTLTDPSTRISEGSQAGRVIIPLQNEALETSVTLGRNMVAKPGARLTHDDVVDDFATSAAGTSLGCGERRGRPAHLGVNSSARHGKSTGAYGRVEVGFVALVNVLDRETGVSVSASAVDRSGLGTPRAQTQLYGFAGGGNAS